MHTPKNPSASVSLHWYAVMVKSRHEKVVSARLAAFAIVHYLPLQRELHRWSDRTQLVDVPLFPGYLFTRLDIYGSHRLNILRTPGVVGFVANQAGPLPIPDEQVESVEIAVNSGLEYWPTETFQERDRVRVVRGPLTGIEGSCLRVGPKPQLVISIDLIGRSLSVSISDSDVELIERRATKYAAS
jgi:transcription antitermination factor NusG